MCGDWGRQEVQKKSGQQKERGERAGQLMTHLQSCCNQWYTLGVFLCVKHVEGTYIDCIISEQYYIITHACREGHADVDAP